MLPLCRNQKRHIMNKYYQILGRVLASGKTQTNRKGNIRYLLNERLTLTPADLLDIFEGHPIARKNSRTNCSFSCRASETWKIPRSGHQLVGLLRFHPCQQLPDIPGKAAAAHRTHQPGKRSSKNYVLFLGSTDAESNQAPCLSLVQFQIEQGELVMTAYQRSSDANLGLPADIYHLYLMSRQIDLPLKSITLNLGNVHIYENNISRTEQLLAGNENIKFELNV